MASIAAGDSTDEMEDFMERYPKDLVVGIDDFHRLDLKSILGSDRKAGYVSLWEPLTTAAGLAIKDGRTSEGKALWLLADASSMMLHPSTPEKPFEPAIVMEGKRSSIPEDFTASDIEFFSTIVDNVEDLWLKARLADLIWMSMKTAGRHNYALIAIDAYRKIPLSPDTWARGVRECWERAISLSKMLGAGAENRVEEMEKAILALFETATSEDEFFAICLAEMLMTNRLAGGEAVNIANKLESLAQHFAVGNDLHHAREFAAGSAEWFRQAKNIRKAEEITVSIAEYWYRDAVAQTLSDPPSYIGARHFYEKSVEVYRALSQDARADLHVEERIHELRELTVDAGRRSIKEMHVFKSPPISLAPQVEATQNAVSGKSTIDALRVLATAYYGVDVESLKENSSDVIRDSPMRFLFSEIRLADDGRVVARRPSLSAGDNSHDVLTAEMIKIYSMNIELAVRSFILPGLHTIALEHRLSEKDFIYVAANSPAVPARRSGLVGKALFAGYEENFVVALHLMVPQIENIVRCKLKVAGADTSTLKDGIETENGLSTLMISSKANEVFGANVAFELKALFCDPLGPNLRNELAHGLMDDEKCQSAYLVYAWWLGFKIVFSAFLDVATQIDTEENPKA